MWIQIFDETKKFLMAACRIQYGGFPIHYDIIQDQLIYLCSSMMMMEWLGSTSDSIKLYHLPMWFQTEAQSINWLKNMLLWLIYSYVL